MKRLVVALQIIKLAIYRLEITVIMGHRDCIRNARLQIGRDGKLFIDLKTLWIEKWKLSILRWPNKFSYPNQNFTTQNTIFKP